MRNFIIFTSLIVSVLGASALMAHGQAQPAPPSLSDIAQQAGWQALKDSVLQVVPGGSMLSAGSKINQAVSNIKKTAGTDSGSNGFSFWGLGWIRIKVITWVLFALNYIIGLIGATLFILAGFFVEIGLYFNTTILETYAVQLGWRIMRDLANLGFTIGIVVIAYGTILDIEAYNIKKLLFSLIVAAVFVNFSFSVIGVLIDGSNMVTHFFVSKSISGGEGGPTPPASGWANSAPHQLAMSLATAFGPQRLLAVNQKDFGAFEALQSEAGMVTMVVATFFIALFTILASLGMLAVATATMYRFVVLSALVILAPIATLAWAFRGTGLGEKPWGEWWQKFTGQLIYLPLLTFFIYLAITLVTISGAAMGSSQLSIGELAAAVEEASGAQGQSALALSGGTATKLLGIMSKPLQAITEMILLLGLLFFGITQSHKFSGVTAGFLVNKAQGMKDWLVSAQKTKYEGAGAREWATRKIGTMGPEPEKNLANQVASITSGIPFLGGLTQRLKTVADSGTKQSEEYATEYTKLTDAQLLSRARNPELLLNAEKQAAMAKVIAQKGKINNDPAKGVSMAEFEKWIPAAKRFGFDKEVLKAAPHLFEKFGWDMGKFNKFMDEDFKPEDMDKVSADALKDKRVAFRLTNAHLKRLDGPSKKEHRQNFIDVFNRGLTGGQRTIIMDEQFKNKKAIDDLHQDFFTSTPFVFGLKEFHVDRLRENADFEQQRQFIKTLYDVSRDPFTPNDVFNTFDNLAKPVIDKKTDNGWTGIMNNPKTKTWFDDIEVVYNQRKRGVRPGATPAAGGAPRGGRAAGGGAGPRPIPPGNNPPPAAGAGGVPPPVNPPQNPPAQPQPPQQINRPPNTP